jgi:hypothetical protein
MRLPSFFKRTSYDQMAAPHTTTSVLALLNSDMSDKKQKFLIKTLLSSNDTNQLPDKACRQWMENLAIEETTSHNKRKHQNELARLKNTLKLLDECKKEIREEDATLRIIISEPTGFRR